jgi:glyoxylase-like metal-dependent hydrolase (beta-lactamase superfamily II)
VRYSLSPHNVGIGMTRNNCTRRWLPALGLGAAAVFAAPVAAQTAPPAQTPPPPPAAARAADLQPLADGVWLLPGRFERGRQPDGNSLVLQGRDGLVIIDSGRHAEHTQALIGFARARGLDIHTVINTHWHLDHLGGNALLRKAQPLLRAMASPAVRDAVEQRMPRSAAELVKELAEPGTDEATRRMMLIDLALLDQRAALAPDELLSGPARDVEVAGRALRIGHERGPSGGDLWVLDRASGTLAIGDFVTLPVPFFDTACAPWWKEALARIGALPFERIVPGHGPVMSREDFGRYARAFNRLLDCAAGPAGATACAAGWVEDLGPLAPAGSQRVAEGMLGYYFEALLRAPAAQQERFCRG